MSISFTCTWRQHKNPAAHLCRRKWHCRRNWPLADQGRKVVESSERREVKWVIQFHHKTNYSNGWNPEKMMTSKTNSFQGTIVIAFRSGFFCNYVVAITCLSISWSWKGWFQVGITFKIACIASPKYKRSTWNKMEPNPCPPSSDSKPTVSIYWLEANSRVPGKILFWSSWHALASGPENQQWMHQFQKPRCSLCLHGRDNYVGKHRNRFVLVGELGLSHVLEKKLWTHLLWSLSLSLSTNN